MFSSRISAYCFLAKGSSQFILANSEGVAFVQLIILMSHKAILRHRLDQGLLNIFDNRCWLFQTNVHANVRWRQASFLNSRQVIAFEYRQGQTFKATQLTPIVTSVNAFTNVFKRSKSVSFKSIANNEP